MSHPPAGNANRSAAILAGDPPHYKKAGIVKNTIIVVKSLCAILLLCTFSACDIASTNVNPSATPRETASLLPSPTPNIPPTITPNSPPENAYKTFSSPNGNWIASIYSPTDRNAPQFATKVRKTDGKFEWTLDYHTSQFEEEAYYYPFYWTNDGQQLYLATYRAMDGCGKVLEFYTGSGLLNLNLQTGELSEIVYEKPLASYAFSISPTESLLVYAEEGEKPPSIRVKNAFGEEVNSITLDEKFDGVGNFTWFPSEDEILFVATENVCKDNQNFALIILNLNTLKTKVIVDKFDRNLTAMEWESTEVLQMIDGQGNIWILDLKSSQLTMVTVTP